MHLLPWLSWAKAEPISIAARVSFLRGARARFDRDEDYTYKLFDRGEQRMLGMSGLHKRGAAGSLEIGYWIAAGALRQGLCSEATAALTHTAFAHCRADWIEIHCDADNLASQAVPRRLGFHLDGVLRRRAITPAGQSRDTMIWSLFADELAATPSAKISYEAFDACGDRMNSRASESHEPTAAISGSE
jgi:RimJ/RimL family protein N-acetyltransferase